MRRRAAVAITLSAGATLVVASALGARAQINPIDPLPTTTTTAPGTAPTTAPLVENPLAPPPTTAPSPAPAPPAGTRSGPKPVPLPGNGGGEGVAPPPDAGPFPAHLAAMSRSVRRTGPRNTNALIEGLKALTDLGVPLEEAMRVGMGNFPVAGRASYSHDWWYPRFGPGWRLHEGTDLFATRGTPVRSPTTGTVRFTNSALGGIATYVVQSDGTYFYMAHLDGRPKGLRDGQAVNTGDIVGYVGTSGNATGGSPHLHFEVHPAIKLVTTGKGKKRTTTAVSRPVRPGTVLPPVDPKPLLDLYLQQAMANLPNVVAAYRANAPAPAPAPASAPGGVAPVALAGQLAAGVGVAPDPLVKTPLLALAFLLVLVVACLTPVLVPRRRLVSGVPPGRHAAEKRARRRPARPAPSGTKPPSDEAKPPSDEAKPPSARKRRRAARRERAAEPTPQTRRRREPEPALA